MPATYSGNVTGIYYGYDDPGLRPLVCLKSSVQLQIEEDGYLWIQ